MGVVGECESSVSWREVGGIGGDRCSAYPLGVDGTEVGVLEETHKVGLGGLLESLEDEC